MVSITAKSTYFKELLFPFFKIFYALIGQYVINFVFSIGKQPYREAINFASYIHVVYSYNDVTTHIYMRTNYLRHLANIIEWSRPVGGGGGCGGGGGASGVVGWERMGTTFPHKKLSGNGVPSRKF